MKLKTKFQDEDFELGEVVDGVIVECLGKSEEKLRVIATAAKGGQHTFYYSSIKKFMDDWEDAPDEPKEYWYINEYGTVTVAEIYGRYNIYDKLKKRTGNYFKSEEEAEKAVAKLKAWKRLKDKGFKFEGRNKPNFGEKFVVECRLPKETLVVDVVKDLDLLFGGKE